MNISFNFTFSNFKYIRKIKRHADHSFLIKYYTDSFFEYHPRKGNDLERKNDPYIKNSRYLFTSRKNINSDKVWSNGKKNENHLIYYGALVRQVKGLKIFSCMTSVAGVSIQPFIAQNILNGKDVLLGFSLLSGIGLFTLTPLLIHSFTKKYVTEIWYNTASDTYTATVLSFFLRPININFKVEDVEIINSPSMFSTMKIKGKPLCVLSECFLETEHYIKIMKLDKPINMKPENKKL